MGAAKQKKTLSPQTASFRSCAYEIARAIPRSRVMTYGAIARLIPPPRGMDAQAYDRIKARWVGYAMADCPEGVPWQRVVNSKGQVSPRPGYDLLYQRHLLEAEGVVFGTEGCVDLDRFGWTPSRGWLARRNLMAPGPRPDRRLPRSVGRSRTSKAHRKGKP
jgi:methylated-DNA-protein-cysteine methyltransferase-like protein